MWYNGILFLKMSIMGVIITAYNFEGVGVKPVVVIGSILGILGSIISTFYICAGKFKMGFLIMVFAAIITFVL